MRNFLRLATNVDPTPLLHALAVREHLWNQNTVRTAHTQSAHRTVDDIVLRYSPFEEGKDDFVDKVCASIHSENTKAYAELPQARDIVRAVMMRVEGEHLGRVMISRTKPGGHIPLHSDLIDEAVQRFPLRIQPAEYYQRYHVVLQSGPGCIFECGDETVTMMPGELWWFDNLKLHRVMNQSAVDRIHLVMDIHVTEYPSD